MRDAEILRQRLIWKLESILYSLLEKVEKQFTEAIESNVKETNQFEEIAEKYNEIKELIKHQRRIFNNNSLVKFYYLEAKFGFIQSTLDSLPKKPITKETLLSNDRKLKKMRRHLKKFYLKATSFLDVENKYELDCVDLLAKIQEGEKTRKISVKQLKADYYYNYALHLIEHNREPILDLQESIPILESQDKSKTIIRLIKKTKVEIQRLNSQQTRKKEESNTQNQKTYKPGSASTNEITGIPTLNGEKKQTQNRLSSNNHQLKTHSSVKVKLLTNRQLPYKKRRLSQAQEFLHTVSLIELITNSQLPFKKRKISQAQKFHYSVSVLEKNNDQIQKLTPNQTNAFIKNGLASHNHQLKAHSNITAELLAGNQLFFSEKKLPQTQDFHSKDPNLGVASQASRHDF